MKPQRRDCKHNDKGICKCYCLDTLYDLRSGHYVPCYVVLQHIPKCKYECRFTQKELEQFTKQIESLPDVPRNEFKWGEWRYGEYTRGEE